MEQFRKELFDSFLSQITILHIRKSYILLKNEIDKLKHYKQNIAVNYLWIF